LIGAQQQRQRRWLGFGGQPLPRHHKKQQVDFCDTFLKIDEE
jgi:hypothetical protein